MSEQLSSNVKWINTDNKQKCIQCRYIEYVWKYDQKDTLALHANLSTQQRHIFA